MTVEAQDTPAAPLFDPASYADVLRPPLEARSLPPACYTDPRFYAREQERVFRRSWMFIGHDGRIPEPGDWVTTDAGGADLIVVRGEDGAVRALANSCRHRGTRLVSGEGNTRLIRCPYHGWTYGCAGELRGAPQMRHTRGFDPAQHGLRAVRTESWGRFLFVNLDDDAPDLQSWLGDLHGMLAPYAFDDLLLTRRREWDLACNWKVYYENLMEPYHTPWVHAGGLALKNEDAGAEMLSGNAEAPFGEGGPDAPVVIEYGANHAALITRHAGSRGLLPGNEPFSPMPTLRGRSREGSIWAYVFPSTVFSCQRECVWYNRIIPRGPDRMTLEIGSCFPAATTRREDFAERVPAYYRRIDRTADEDAGIVVEQQAGLASPLARAGPLSHLEVVCHAHRKWVIGRVLDGLSEPDGRGS